MELKYASKDTYAMRPYATEYENGINIKVTKAGTASPMYFQLTKTICLIIIQPTIISVHPVAHGGIEAKMGAKKMEIKNKRPVVMAVRPVLPPSAMPAALSINAVTGDTPRRA